MAPWLLAICSIWLLWLQPVSSGSDDSKIRVLDDYVRLIVPSESEEQNRLLPRGRIEANLKKLLAAHLERRALGPEDGLVAITVDFQDVTPTRLRMTEPLVLRVIDASMLISIKSLHRRVVADRVEYYEAITWAWFIDENNWGPPTFQHWPISPNKYDKSSLFKPNEVPQFDIKDVFKAMKQNWYHRIYFQPELIEKEAFMRFTRPLKIHPVSALQNAIVINFEIGKNNVVIAPDDGLDFAHLYVLQQESFLDHIDPLTFQRDNPLLFRPPNWLARAKALQASQN